ncbi:MAG: AI-2E family transporter [Sandaracinaceae bacterium]|nr:AI-2E family transporter [Myxococcales bacterium]MCB9657045.1 AI-2E family transporter [Sandaracinaceae bacterium]
MTDGSDPTAPPSPPTRALPRTLIVAAGVVLTLVMVWVLRAVFTPLFFAFFIAYMLDPLVDRFEARGLPRGAGIAVLLAGTLGALVVAMLLVLPGIVSEFTAFAQALPGKLQDWVARLEPLLTRYGVPVPHTLDEALASLQVDAREVASSAVTPVSSALRWVAGGTASVFSAVAGGLMVPVFAFYLLYDFDRIVAAGGELVPYRHRPIVFRMAADIDEVLGHWVRGQFLVMVALGALYAVAFSLAGAPLAIPIGIIAGLLSFIPYVGGALGLGLALLTCAVEGRLWPSMGYVVVAFGIVQVLEGFVITPKLVGDKVGLSAVVVLLALMIGNELFGFLGVLMAVPGAAVVKIFVVRATRAYRASDFFGTPTDEPTPMPDTLAAALDDDGDGGGEPHEPDGAADDGAGASHDPSPRNEPHEPQSERRDDDDPAARPGDVPRAGPRDTSDPQAEASPARSDGGGVGASPQRPAEPTDDDAA